MAGPSLVIRFGAGRITLALDDDSASGLPACKVTHQPKGRFDQPA